MPNPLEHIIQQKKREIDDIKNKSAAKSFKNALSCHDFSIIGEIKRASPSKGMLANITQPLTLLKSYLDGGIRAVSVLTESTYFKGSLKDLTDVYCALKNTTIPVLRKDFILDKTQLIESVRAGADAVLLIASILKEKTHFLYQEAMHMGLECIVEVHTEDELHYVLGFHPDVILINNRNLHTLQEDINTCLTLAPYIPQDTLSIAASAIRTPIHLKDMKRAGYRAALIGETLVTASNPTQTLKRLQEAL